MKFRTGIAPLAAALICGITLTARADVPPPPDIAASSYLLVDAGSNQVLVEHEAHTQLPPASLTKIMTTYVAGEAIDAGHVKLTDSVPVSVHAWQAEGSRMFIREGTEVPLSDLLRGIIIQSGNDASIAVAEYIGGSEDAFANMMNQQAEKLGLKDSYFINATGLPAEGHHTTAWDLAQLSRALINNHPTMYAMYAERTFRFNNIDQTNRNRLLWRDRSVDGIKTGHTEEAGFCLVASAIRDNMRLISVVMGTKDDNARMDESQKLIAYGFRHFETRELYGAGVVLKQNEVFYGDEDTVDLGLATPAVVTFPRGRYGDLKAELEVPKILEAPYESGVEVGRLRLTLDDKPLYEAPLVTLKPVAQAGVFSRMSDFIYLFFRELFGDD
ncbi:MAG: D-alanyl-D-alanine carboxypeptidase [Pseudomonadales bacterium]|nr:D-alanyl-D-alanine carboxypeptidase [Pseudomonadales bacterium]